MGNARKKEVKAQKTQVAESSGPMGPGGVPMPWYNRGNDAEQPGSSDAAAPGAAPPASQQQPPPRADTGKDKRGKKGKDKKGLSVSSCNSNAPVRVEPTAPPPQVEAPPPPTAGNDNPFFGNKHLQMQEQI